MSLENTEAETAVEVIGPAPEGTYAMLESLLEGDDTRIWGSVRHLSFVRVFAERDCKETNGSCMDLLIRHRKRGQGIEVWSHTHVTKNDEIVRLHAGIMSSQGSQSTEPPTLEEMIDDFNKIRERLSGWNPTREKS